MTPAAVRYLGSYRRWVVLCARLQALSFVPLIVAVVTASTSLMFIVAKLASTAEQAGVAQSILAVSLGLAGGAFFPITGTGLLARVLDGDDHEAVGRRQRALEDPDDLVGRALEHQRVAHVQPA